MRYDTIPEFLNALQNKELDPKTLLVMYDWKTRQLDIENREGIVLACHAATFLHEVIKITLNIIDLNDLQLDFFCQEIRKTERTSKDILIQTNGFTREDHFNLLFQMASRQQEEETK